MLSVIDHKNWQTNVIRIADIIVKVLGYSIERKIIDKLIDIQILIAYQNDQGIASSILFNTGDILHIIEIA